MLLRLAIGAAILAAVAGASFGFGYAHGVDKGYRSALDASKTSVDDANARATAADDALDDVRDKLAQSKADLHDAELRAERELSARALRIAALEFRAKQQSQAIAGAAHADPDCAALADMPVCDAVARRMWPAASATVAAH